MTMSDRRSHHSRFQKGRAALAALFLAAIALGANKSPDLSKIPAPASSKIDFDRDVKPIFTKSCISCHGPEKQKSDYRLDVKTSALRGGSIGGAIVPGDGTKSLLIQYVA